MTEPLLEIPGTALPWWAEDLRTETGYLVDDLLIEEYHSTTALVSKSTIDVAARSLAHYRYRLDHPESEQERNAPRVADPAEEDRVIGNAFHTLVLEPMTFDRRYLVVPDFGDMRSSKNRDFRDAFLRENAQGRIPLKKEWSETIHGMREACFQHKKLRKYLEEGEPEVTAIARDPRTGLPRKSRIDWHATRLHSALDLKSARDGSRNAWRREAGSRRYHVQDPFYTETFQLAGVELDDFVFGVVEKEPPYVIGLYNIDDRGRLAGEKLYMRVMEQIAQACRSGEYPGYTTDVESIDIPVYAILEAETES